MIFICRSVKGYNDCTCCCSCCLSDVFSKSITVNGPANVSANQVEPEVRPEILPEVANDEGTEATEIIYWDLEGTQLEYVQKGLSSFTFESNDHPRPFMTFRHQLYHKLFMTFD